MKVDGGKLRSLIHLIATNIGLRATPLEWEVRLCKRQGFGEASLCSSSKGLSGSKCIGEEEEKEGGRSHVP